MIVLRTLAVLVAVASLEAAAEEPEASVGWEGSTVSLGVVALSGNSRSVTVNGEALTDYRSESWELHGELGVILGWAADAGEEEGDSAAEWVRGHVRGERRFGSRFTAFLLLGGEVNHPASLEGRAEAEAGLGITVLEVRDEEGEEVQDLRVYLGAHVSNDYRFQFFPVRTDVEDVFMLGPGVGLRWRWRPSPPVELSELLRIYPNVWGDARVLSYSDSRLVVNLTERLAIDIHLLLEHDTGPAPGRRRLDLALTTGLLLQL